MSNYVVPQRQYDPAYLAEAASLVKRGRMSGSNAADIFSVPRTTLRRHMKAKQPPKKRMIYCSNLCRVVASVTAQGHTCEYTGNVSIYLYMEIYTYPTSFS